MMMIFPDIFGPSMGLVGSLISVFHCNWGYMMVGSWGMVDSNWGVMDSNWGVMNSNGWLNMGD